MKKLSLLLIVVGFGLLFSGKVRLEKMIGQNKKSIALTKIQAGYHAKSLKTYSFGFDLFVSDLLWISLLQNASHLKAPEGEVTWEFAQLDAISTLDPKFTRAYNFGSVFLSVFRQDKAGAEILLRKWVRRYPRSWEANSFLGYHLFYELKKYDEAAKYLVLAAQFENAPPYLSALGVRLLGQTGQYATALRSSLELAQVIQSAEALFRLKKRVRALRFALQKQVLTDALEEYRATHKKEPSSTQELVPKAQTQMRDLASVVPANLPEGWEEILMEKFAFTYNPSTKSIESVKSEKELEIDAVGLRDKEKKNGN